MMAKFETIKKISIFVASPNDMQPFRNELVKVVNNLNRNLLDADERELDLKTAQENVPACWGADPQFLINEGIADDYDFIIVILGSRVGTKTPRKIAGTLEEFTRARDRYKQNGTPQILVYFCTEPKNPHDLDPNQLKHVHKFREEIEDEGFYKFFKTKKDFKECLERDLRLHLRKPTPRRPRRGRDVNVKI